MRRDCRLLTFQRTILSLIIYDLPTSSRAVVKSFDIDYLIAGRIWQDLGNHTHIHTDTDTHTHALLSADIEDLTERDGSRFAVETAIITKLFSISN